MLFFGFKSMPQADSVQFKFSPPPQPTPGEFAFALSPWRLIGLAMIVAGAYALYRSNLALVSLALGFGACFLLGFSFTPINHRRFAWSEDGQNINRWINSCLVLMIWGAAPQFYWQENWETQGQRR
jgi:hypothetical protein